MGARLQLFQLPPLVHERRHELRVLLRQLRERLARGALRRAGGVLHAGEARGELRGLCAAAAQLLRERRLARRRELQLLLQAARLGAQRAQLLVLLGGGGEGAGQRTRRRYCRGVVRGGGAREQREQQAAGAPSRGRDGQVAAGAGGSSHAWAILVPSLGRVAASWP
jgi:hypothetical protein